MFRTRWAEDKDASFLADIILIAGRAHGCRSAFDLIVESSESARLKYIRALVVSKFLNPCHLSAFRVAEVDGTPVAALCAYVYHKARSQSLVAASDDAADALNWTVETRMRAWQRASMFMTCVMEPVEGMWIIDSLAALEAYRRLGLATQLLNESVRIGMRRGHSVAQITVLIGNTAAQRLYEKMGFKPVEEKRHPVFESAVGSPGFLRMVRD